MSKRKKSDIKSIWHLISIIIIVILSSIGIEYVDGTQIVNVTIFEKIENIEIKTGKEINNKFISQNSNNLKVYYFDVGQADSILVMNEDKTMLIDAGNNEDGALLVKNLKKLNVTKIDYLVGTHPHEDHIGGLDNIIKNFDIETIYMPKVQTNTKTFEDVLDAVFDKGLKITTPEVNDTFKVGSAECKILAVGDNKENLNSTSIVIQMDFEGIKYAFMGDAEKDVEDALLNKNRIDKINILKVGHHGSDTSSLDKFINKIAPELSIISVGKDNEYNHPSQVTIQRLEKLGSKIYRTDEVGNIMIEQKVREGDNL